MVLVHTAQCLAPKLDPDQSAIVEWAQELYVLPLALFLLVSGASASLLSRSAARSHREERILLWRRGAVLFLIGAANMLVWPDDVIRIFGVFLLLAPLALRARGTVLLLVAIGILVLQYALLLELAPEDQNWLEPLESPPLPAYYWQGFLLSGARPLLPWLAAPLLGLWLARFELTRRSTQAWLFVGGTLAIGVAVAGHELLYSTLPERALFWQAALAAFADDPPSLIFLLSSAGGTCALLAAMMFAGQWRPRSFLITALADCGKMALTWYVAHVCFLQGLAALGLETDGVVAFVLGLQLCVLLVALSMLTAKAHKRGPLEALLRRAAG